MNTTVNYLFLHFFVYLRKSEFGCPWIVRVNIDEKILLTRYNAQRDYLKLKNPVPWGVRNLGLQ